MKKILSRLATPLFFIFFSALSYAGGAPIVPCAGGDGANLAGCTIGTTDTTYTLTGDIQPDPGVKGIEFQPGATGNATTLTGNITTSGDDAYGVYLGTSNSNTTTLTGNITTSGDDAYGLYLNGGDNNTTDLIGNITASGGDLAIGLRLRTSNSNTTTLTGNITISGEEVVGDAVAAGIFVDDSYDNTIQTGNITISGEEDAVGIFIENFGTSSLGNTIQTGDITISGGDDGGFGIFLDGAWNDTIVTGNISIEDPFAAGIIVEQSRGVSIQVNGDISLIGGDTVAIGLLDSDSTSITVSGDITTAHDAIEVFDSSFNTITLNGKVSANAGDDAAIYVDSTSDNNTFTLNQGSVIDGRLYNDGSNNTLKLNLGAGRSYALETTGSSSWTIEDLNNRPMVTGSAYGIGVGNMETQGHEMYQRTYQVNQTLQQRQLANYKGNATPYWINSYYNESSRSGSANLSSNNLQFSNHRSGVNLGYRVTQYEQPIELLFNYENSSMNHDDFNHQISSDSMMVGVLMPNIQHIAGGELSVNAMLGISDFRGNRQVMTNSAGYSGMRTIGSDYQAKHYVVGAGWLKALFKGEMLQTYVNIGADINHQRMESYREEAYYKFDSRDITQLQTRMTLATDVQPFNNQLNINVNLGVENRNMIAGTQQGLSLNNTKTGYSHMNQSNTYLTSSLNISYPLTNAISAYAGYQYFDSGDDIKMSSGQIGVSGSF